VLTFSGQAEFRAGFGPASALSLSKYFARILSLHAKFVSQRQTRSSPFYVEAFKVVTSLVPIRKDFNFEQRNEYAHPPLFPTQPKNTPLASASLGMLRTDFVFSLLAWLLPWNGHRLEMTVTLFPSKRSFVLCFWIVRSDHSAASSLVPNSERFGSRTKK